MTLKCLTCGRYDGEMGADVQERDVGEDEPLPFCESCYGAAQDREIDDE
jgi:hypothetical protein